MLYMFEISHHTAETTKNIYGVKCKSVVDYSNQIVEEILIGLKEPQQIRQSHVGLKLDSAISI